MARRILVLAPFPPRLDGTHGGTRAIAQLLCRTAERSEVGLLCFRARGEDGVDAEVSSRCAFVREVERPVPPAGSSVLHPQRLRVLGRRIRGTPIWAAKFVQPDFVRLLEAYVRDWRPQIVEAHYHVTAQFLLGRHVRGSDVRRVFVSYEPGAVNANSLMAQGGRLRRLSGRLEERAWFGFERRLLDAVDAAVVLTARDEASYHRLGASAPIVRIPLGIDLPARPLDPFGVNPPRLVFVGNFVHSPNRDAAMRLATVIFPTLRAARPDLQLDLVGDNPFDRLKALAGDGIHVPGRVDDVAPYLNRAAIVVVPLRQGGGMRVKVLEALAAGKAVVASPLALEGMEATPGDYVAIAETDEEFVREIDALLREPQRRLALAARAREFAALRLGWDASVQQYEKLYDSLLGPLEPAQA
jgi:polysaccharide biosynthesis protein PslH